MQCCFKMKGWDRRRTHCQMLVAISIKNKPFFFVLCCQGIASVCFSTAGLFLFYFCSSGTPFWEFEFITLKAFIICYHCGISIKSVVKPKHTHAHSYTWLNHFKKVFLFTYQSIKNYHTHLFIYACLYVIYFNNYTRTLICMQFINIIYFNYFPIYLLLLYVFCTFICIIYCFIFPWNLFYSSWFVSLLLISFFSVYYSLLHLKKQYHGFCIKISHGDFIRPWRLYQGKSNLFV